MLACFLALRRLDCFSNLVRVPAGAVLVLEQDQVAQLVQPGTVSRVVHQHQRE
jgi:hypothetical protein